MLSWKHHGHRFLEPGQNLARNTRCYIVELLPLQWTDRLTMITLRLSKIYWMAISEKKALVTNKKNQNQTKRLENRFFTCNFEQARLSSKIHPQNVPFNWLWERERASGAKCLRDQRLVFKWITTGRRPFQLLIPPNQNLKLAAPVAAPPPPLDLCVQRERVSLSGRSNLRRHFAFPPRNRDESVLAIKIARLIFSWAAKTKRRKINKRMQITHLGPVRERVADGLRGARAKLSVGAARWGGSRAVEGEFETFRRARRSLAVTAYFHLQTGSKTWLRKRDLRADTSNINAKLSHLRMNSFHKISHTKVLIGRWVVILYLWESYHRHWNERCVEVGSESNNVVIGRFYLNLLANNAFVSTSSRIIWQELRILNHNPLNLVFFQ